VLLTLYLLLLGGGESKGSGDVAVPNLFWRNAEVTSLDRGRPRFPWF